MMKMMFGRLAPQLDHVAGRLASSPKAGAKANQTRQARQLRPARESGFSFSKVFFWMGFIGGSPESTSGWAQPGQLVRQVLQEN